MIMPSITEQFLNSEKEKETHFAVIKTQGTKKKRDGSCDPQRRTNEQEDLSSNI